VFGVFELVGVGAGVESLSHLVNWMVGQLALRMAVFGHMAVAMLGGEWRKGRGHWGDQRPRVGGGGYRDWVPISSG